MAEHEQLRRRVEALERHCTPPYSDEHAAQVGKLIADMRKVLADGGTLGQWEELELSRAEVARQNNMLALAVFRASKALALHHLPASEYAAGLSTSG